MSLRDKLLTAMPELVKFPTLLQEAEQKLAADCKSCDTATAMEDVRRKLQLAKERDKLKQSW